MSRSLHPNPAPAAHAAQPAAPARPCLLCRLLRRAGQVVMLVLLPRTFAFVAALVVLVLMAPSSMPTSKPAEPKLPALPGLPNAAAVKASLQGTAQSAKEAAASAAAAAAASAAAPAIAPAIAQANAAASAANAALARLTARVNAAASAAAAAATGSTAATTAATTAPTTAAAPAVASAAASSAATAASPAPAVGASALSTSAVAAAASSASAATALRFSPIALPYGRVGVRWGPRKMVELGKPPYSMEFVGPRPAWITEYKDGTLAGTPDTADTYTFTLRATSQAAAAGQPPPIVEQTFTVRVQEGGSARSAQSAKTAKTAEVILPAHRKSTNGKPLAPPTTDRYTPQTFRLEAADLAEWPWEAKQAADGTATTPAPATAATAAPATAAGATPATAGVPVKKRWTDMLAPLQGLDYPTEALFRTALALAHCSAYQALVTQNRKTAAPEAPSAEVVCPQEVVMAAGTGVPEDEMCAAWLPAPSDSFESLMPPAVRECLVQKARRLHRPEKQIPTLWAATPGCACVPPARDNEVYGFVSYWGSTEQQQAAAALAAENPASAPRPGSAPATRQIDYGLYTRLSFFGAVLNDKGDYVLPRAVALQGQRLAHDALQYQTQTDLVVYRNDWDLLLKEKWAASDRPPEAVKNFIAEAAANAVKLINVDQPYVSRVYQNLLLPFWRERSWAYNGVTVFFDNAPATGTEAGARYTTFLKQFMDTLIVKLQETERAYHLNVVVPGDRLGDDGPYNFRDMNGWIEAAEPQRASKQVEADKKRHYTYKGKADITVEFIVLLADPATDSKKDVRARMDRSDALSGTTRVVFLQSMVPLMLRPAAGQPLWLGKSPEQQWDDELAYMKWNFGGVSVWEPPASATNDGVLKQHLSDNFRAETNLTSSLCSWVCPNRLGQRLLLQALVLVGAVALGAWLMSCTVRSWGRAYRYFLGGGFLVTVLLFQAMLQCDPSLAALRDSPLPVLIYLALVLGLIGRFIFKSSHEATA